MTDHSILWEMGYRPIASEAHATQLLRRELKRMRASQQRHGHLHGVDYPRLLSITPGTWYRFFRPDGARQAVLMVNPSACTPPAAANPTTPDK